VNRLNSLVHVHVQFRQGVSRKPQLNPPLFVTSGICPHILISRHPIVPNAKDFGNEQPLADLDFEILGIGNQTLELSTGTAVAREGTTGAAQESMT
jgi:hypothetical protein